jgi:hypothetical protein
MSSAQIAEFLGHLGWSYQIMTDSVLRAQYQGVFGPTKVLLHVHDGGLRMAINPVLDKPLDPGGWNRSVARLLIALNKESPNIRIGLDKEGDLYVKVDLAPQNLNFAQFSYILMNLCKVSEQLTVPVLQAQAYEHSVAQAF